VKLRPVRVTDRATSGFASGMVQWIGWLFKERLKVEQESAQLGLDIASIEARAANKATSRSDAGARFGTIEPDAVCT
jgi:hypothetical protein